MGGITHSSGGFCLHKAGRLGQAAQKAENNVFVPIFALNATCGGQRLVSFVPLLACGGGIAPLSASGALADPNKIFINKGPTRRNPPCESIERACVDSWVMAFCRVFGRSLLSMQSAWLRQPLYADRWRFATKSFFSKFLCPFSFLGFFGYCS